jgi:5-methylcytosine-specific restriction endonuclease McrA
MHNAGTFKKGHVPYMKGRKHTADANQKNRDAHLGKSLSETHKQKIAAGSKRTMHTRQAFSMSGHSHSEETRLKMSKAQSGHVVSQDTRDKLCMCNTGKQHSIATRLKMSVSHKKKKPYNWKGGRSKHYKTGYYSVAYKLWRESVFARDDYTCQMCGAAKVYLTAHHLKSFAHYPTLRFEITNGQTLCEECHKSTDNYMGRRKRR